MKWRSLDKAASLEDTRSLREQFAERKELSAKYVPPETQAIHARVISELRERGIVSAVLSQGAKAPQAKGHSIIESWQSWPRGSRRHT
jgi:hypothetical protein